MEALSKTATMSLQLNHNVGDNESICQAADSLLVVGDHLASDIGLIPGSTNGVMEESILAVNAYEGLSGHNIDNTEFNKDQVLQVILWDRDIFTCGVCSGGFGDMQEFLIHKSQHTIAPDIYKCELCKVAFLSQDILLDHYRAHHNLHSLQTTLIHVPPDETVLHTNAIGTETLDHLDKKPSFIKEAKSTSSNIVALNGHGLAVQNGDVELNGKHVSLRSLLPCGNIDANISHHTNGIKKVVDHELPLHTHLVVPSSGTLDETSLPEFDDPDPVDVENVSTVIQKCQLADIVTITPTDIPTDEINQLNHDEINNVGVVYDDNQGTEDGEIGEVSQNGIENSWQQAIGLESGQTFQAQDLEQHVSEEMQPEEENHGDSDNSNENSHENDAAAGENEEENDFTFILRMEPGRNPSRRYTRCYLQCIQCEQKFHSKGHLIKHMISKHENLLNVHDHTIKLEPQTGTSFGSRKLMKMSEYNHYMCLSDRRPTRVGKRARRLEKQDVPGTYPCSQCTKVFGRLRYLRKHAETHRTDTKFVCELCGKSFKCQTYLRMHRKVHQERVFKCNQCDFTSQINAAIHAHRQIHSQGSVLCDICGYAYTDKSTLTKHKRVHDPTRQYKCNFQGCTWRFKTDIMCKAHIRAHTTQGKFKCVCCGYIFRHKHHLQRHETNMHGIKHSKSVRNPATRSTTSTTTSSSRAIGKRKPPPAHLLPQEVIMEAVTMPEHETKESVNVIITSDEIATAEELHLDEGTLGTSQLVVTADSEGTPIAWGLLSYQA